MKRILALVLSLMLVASWTLVLADSSWDCTKCGAKDNTWNFCPSCGATKPAATPATWDCSKCGAKGNTAKYCPSCGSTKTNASAVVNTNTNIRVGQYVYFGKYEQDNNTVNGSEKIQWKVLDVQNGKALLLSRYGLHRMTFNPTSNRCNWEDSGIRTWLNQTFYTQAFTTSEKNSIQTTLVDEGLDQCHPERAPKRLGNDTYDKVFLLSYAEAIQYLPSDRDRMCVPSDKALAEGCNKSDKRYLDGQYKTCWWWLRSPAYNNNFVVADWTGVLDTCYMSHTYGVVRPAIWVSTSALK